MNKKYIIKYIKGDMDSAERRKTVEWIRKTPENQKIYNIIKAEYIASSFKDVPNNNNAFFFERLKHRIIKKKLNNLIYVCASIMIIGFFVWNFQFRTDTSDIVPQETVNVAAEINTGAVSFVTLRGDKKEIYLPDGSKIVLNADSELTYPKAF